MLTFLYLLAILYIIGFILVILGSFSRAFRKSRGTWVFLCIDIILLAMAAGWIIGMVAGVVSTMVGFIACSGLLCELAPVFGMAFAFALLGAIIAGGAVNRNGAQLKAYAVKKRDGWSYAILANLAVAAGMFLLLVFSRVI